MISRTLISSMEKKGRTTAMKCLLTLLTPTLQGTKWTCWWRRQERAMMGSGQLIPNTRAETKEGRMGTPVIMWQTANTSHFRRKTASDRVESCRRSQRNNVCNNPPSKIIMKAKSFWVQWHSNSISSNSRGYTIRVGHSHQWTHRSSIVQAKAI